MMEFAKKQSLFLDTLSNLSLETTLDRTDRPSGSTRHAGHEEDPVLLRQEGIKGFARLAGDVFDYSMTQISINLGENLLEDMNRTDVTTKHVFDLFLLEATFNNQAAGAVHRPGCTHFSEHELNDVFWLSVHSFANIWNICEDRFLVPFPHDLWGGNSVALCVGGEKGRIRGMELSVESFKKLYEFVSEHNGAWGGCFPS